MAIKWDRLPDVMQIVHLTQVFECSAHTARKLLETGEIPAVKVGQKWQVAKTNVMAYVENGGRNDREKGDAA